MHDNHILRFVTYSGRYTCRAGEILAVEPTEENGIYSAPVTLHCRMAVVHVDASPYDIINLLGDCIRFTTIDDKPIFLRPAALASVVEDDHDGYIETLIGPHLRPTGQILPDEEARITELKTTKEKNQ